MPLPSISVEQQLPPSSSLSLANLFPELFNSILSYLPNYDIKNLRLTCKELSEKASFRLDRVFLSANPCNIEVSRAIADHEKLRHKVVEIIWDDALLVSRIIRPDEHIHALMDSSSPEECPGWFARACSENTLDGTIKRKTELPLVASWNYYQQLLLQQEGVLASKADVNALRYALERFPSLKRITITPAAHGSLDAPLYETPMIRTFPPGFNYPIPRGWPVHELGKAPDEVPPWDESTTKNQWRGFCIITQELAKREKHRISELITDVRELQTGLSCRIFDGSNEEYNNFVDLLRRPGFARIDLALLADGQYYSDENWSSFRSGYLRQALGEATGLLHASLRTEIDYDQIYGEFPDHLIPLRTIFPINNWQQLQHFRLSNFLVKQDDVLSLLAELPATLRSVELSFLTFVDNGGDYYELVLGMRDTLGWRGRAANERPRVVMHVHVSSAGRMSPLRYLCVDGEVNEFLYGDARNPFDSESGGQPIPGSFVEQDPFGIRICQQI